VYTLADEWQYGASAEETPFLNFPLNNNGEALRPLRFFRKYLECKLSCTVPMGLSSDLAKH